jgi:hypothetical protein
VVYGCGGANRQPEAPPSAIRSTFSRHRLRRQPSGFERFLPLLIHAEALNGPVSDRERPGGPSPHLDSVASERMQRPRDHYVLAGLDELMRLDLSRLPDANELIQDRASLI